MSVKDEVLEAAKAGAEVFEAALGEGSTVDKILPVVTKFVAAFDEFSDFKAMGAKDRGLAIVDTAEEMLHILKDKFIKYSDE